MVTIGIKNKTPEVWPVMLTLYNADLSIDRKGIEALVDWYLQNQVSGIFAVCLSSEMYSLTPEERYALASLTVKQTRGKVPVVACAGFGDEDGERLDDIRKMADTGVDAVILPLSALFAQSVPDAQVIEGILRLIERVPGIDFGVYECPVPYKRYLTAAMLKELLRNTNRLRFQKDTCCDISQLAAKASAAEGSRLKLLNANITTLLESVLQGVDGYCGIAANVVPEQLVELLRYFLTAPEQSRQMQRVLNLLEFALECHYPRGAKALLKMRGLKVNDFCRISQEPCSPDEMTRVGDLLYFLSLWKRNQYYFKEQ